MPLGGWGLNSPLSRHFDQFRCQTGPFAQQARAFYGEVHVVAIERQIADRIEQNLEKLAYAETVDNGKPMRETLNADIPLAIGGSDLPAGLRAAGEAAERHVLEELEQLRPRELLFGSSLPLFEVSAQNKTPTLSLQSRERQGWGNVRDRTSG